ncbi:MAG: TlpA family protein disulfide reductase [Muribaculaceae bacterium]|nr:TlpA family protein disulfide reductase [Muribaculaceae bacterium]
MKTTRLLPILCLTCIALSAYAVEPTTEWNGFDPERYADMKFYDGKGVAHIRGRITDFSPNSGVSTFSIRTINDFTHEQKVNIGDINPDGSFGIDIPLAYPQYDFFQLGNISKDIFLIPGDTLSIVTSSSTRIDPNKGHVPELWRFEESGSDGFAINMLVDSLYNRYGLKTKYSVQVTDSMKSVIYRLNDRLASLLDSVLEDIPAFTENLPVSGFVKDVLTVSAIGRIIEQMEDNQLNFMSTQGSPFKRDAEGNLVMKEPEHLDEIILLKPWLRHKDLIYNNPLLLSHGWILPNRWAFNPQFIDSRTAAVGMEKAPGTIAYVESDNLSDTYSKIIDRLDSIGPGNCFVAQFIRTSSLIDQLKQEPEPSYESLTGFNRLVSQVIRHNDYDRLNDMLMEQYNDYVGKVLVAENRLTGFENSGMTVPDTPEGKVLARIIEPYKGNALYLDFWGIGCGPCRAGMKAQKPILEKLANKPFKALYIAESNYMDACRDWLEKEGIKGEHIFISQDDWQRLTGLFNFSAIPFGVLIDKDGKIIKTHYDLSEMEYEQHPLLKIVLGE